MNKQVCLALFVIVLSDVTVIKKKLIYEKKPIEDTTKNNKNILAV